MRSHISPAVALSHLTPHTSHLCSGGKCSDSRSSDPGSLRRGARISGRRTSPEGRLAVGEGVFIQQSRGQYVDVVNCPVFKAGNECLVLDLSGTRFDHVISKSM